MRSCPICDKLANHSHTDDGYIVMESSKRFRDSAAGAGCASSVLLVIIIALFIVGAV